MTRNVSKSILPTGLMIAMALSGCGGGGGTDAAGAAQNAASALAANSSAERPSRVPFIVGGSEVGDTRYPWMTALLSAGSTDAANGQFCGGSLIADRWVLTAAHCVEQETASSTDVLIGQRDLNDSGGERISVSRIIVHPDYASKGFPDLALLELASPSAAPVITLPTVQNPVPRDGETSTVIGWGQISENGPATAQLRETDVPIVDHATCNAAYNGQIDEQSMVCAGSPSGDRDSCYGDSGGPLFVQRDSAFVQAGVVSFGEACGLAGVPGVYARVSSYHDWIAAYADITSFGGAVPPVDGDTPVQPAEPDGNEGDQNGPDAGENEPWEEEGDDNYWDEWDADFGDEDDYWDEWDEESADESDTLAPISAGPWQYTGELNGWWDEAYAPADDGLIAMAAGKLSVTLDVPADQIFVVFLDRYDARRGEWTDVAGAVSQNGSATIEIDVERGYYSFGVMSLGDGGRYTLDAFLQER